MPAREPKGAVGAGRGETPGILYGMKKEAVAIALPGPLAEAVIHSGAHVMEIKLEGQTEKVLIKAVQYDYLNKAIEHVDLQRIDPNQKVRVKVPLEFRGTPKGAKEGGILETQIAEIEIEVKALEIPDLIRLNVEHLELHQAIYAKEVAIPVGAKLINHPDAIVCQVRTVKEEVAEVVAEAGPAEPEVIGKKKEEEGVEGAEGAAPAAGGKAAAAGGKAAVAGKAAAPAKAAVPAAAPAKK